MSNLNIEETILQSAESFAQEKMTGINPSHGWDHVLRVTANAKRIAVLEKGSDPFIVHISALLHDISRKEQDAEKGSICHAQEGSKVAYDFLIKTGLDEKRALHVSECIKTHRFRENSEPDSIEAKILFDADKLDSIGAVGIGRAFLFSGEVGAKLHNFDADIELSVAYGYEDTAFREYTVKLKHVKDRMLTDAGRKIAFERSAFMETFFDQLNQEIEGQV